MIFGGIQKSSTIDFPGTLCCVLFVRGCDLDCFYCHNRPLLSPGEALSEESVLAFLEKRRGLLDGVTVSGGEPVLQPDLEAFLEKLRGMSYRIKLDTNGQHPGAVGALLKKGFPDYCAVDVKAPAALYPSVCGGGSPAKAGETLSLLREAGTSFEARTTLYPGMGLEDLKNVLGSFPPMPLWRLNYFRMPEHFRPEDGERLALPALIPQKIGAALPELLSLQPKLVWS